MQVVKTFNRSDHIFRKAQRKKIRTEYLLVILSIVLCQSLSFAPTKALADPIDLKPDATSQKSWSSMPDEDTQNQTAPPSKKDTKSQDISEKTAMPEDAPTISVAPGTQDKTIDLNNTKPALATPETSSSAISSGTQGNQTSEDLSKAPSLDTPPSSQEEKKSSQTLKANAPNKKWLSFQDEDEDAHPSANQTAKPASPLQADTTKTTEITPASTAPASAPEQTKPNAVAGAKKTKKPRSKLVEETNKTNPAPADSMSKATLTADEAAKAQSHTEATVSPAHPVATSLPTSDKSAGAAVAAPVIPTPPTSPEPPLISSAVTTASTPAILAPIAVNNNQSQVTPASATSDIKPTSAERTAGTSVAGTPSISAPVTIDGKTASTIQTPPAVNTQTDVTPAASGTSTVIPSTTAATDTDTKPVVKTTSDSGTTAAATTAAVATIVATPAPATATPPPPATATSTIANTTSPSAAETTTAPQIVTPSTGSAATIPTKSASDANAVTMPNANQTSTTAQPAPPTIAPITNASVSQNNPSTSGNVPAKSADNSKKTTVKAAKTAQATTSFNKNTPEFGPSMAQAKLTQQEAAAAQSHPAAPSTQTPAATVPSALVSTSPNTTVLTDEPKDKQPSFMDNAKVTLQQEVAAQAVSAAAASSATSKMQEIPLSPYNTPTTNLTPPESAIKSEIAAQWSEKLEVLEKENIALRDKLQVKQPDSLSDIKIDVVTQIREDVLRARVNELEQELNKIHMEKEPEGVPPVKASALSPKDKATIPPPQGKTPAPDAKTVSPVQTRSLLTTP